MKSFSALIAALAGLLLGQSATAGTFVINPLNVPESCLNQNVRIVRDFRFKPVKIVKVYTAAMKRCHDVAGARLTVTALNGSEWTGSAGYVVIRNSDGNCLTNPSTYRGLLDKSLKWKTCAPQDGSIEAARQMFYTSNNGQGASRFVSHLQYAVGLPNAQQECMERNGPEVVERRICNNLNNWQIHH